jgi:hypothetical protein
VRVHHRAAEDTGDVRLPAIDTSTSTEMQAPQVSNGNQGSQNRPLDPATLRPWTPPTARRSPFRELGADPRHRRRDSPLAELRPLPPPAREGAGE